MELKSTVPVGRSGEWEVSRFTVSQEDASFHNLRCAIHGENRDIEAGEYTQLKRGGTIVMSDTPAEISDFIYQVKEFHGDVLIAGLGLGLVTEAIARNKKVKSICVVEKSQDVIDLVWRHLVSKTPVGKMDNYGVVCQDIFDFKPAMNYDFAWFDIWDYIVRDNIPEFTRLKRKFVKKITNKLFWCEDQCRNARF